MEDPDNIIDFTAYKMRSLVKQLDEIGRDDLAGNMQDALDAYLLGEIDIEWSEGWPYLAGSPPEPEDDT